MKYPLPFIIALLTIHYCTAQTGQTLFNQGIVHEIRVTFEEDNFWTILSQNYQAGQGNSGSNIEYLMGTVEIDGIFIDSVGVRQKGFSSHFLSNGIKKSLKLDFNEFVMGQKYEGLRKVNLNNGVGDPALQRDLLCFDLIREAGGIAPRVAHAKVYLNDEYWGLYVLVEQIDEAFLDENFANGNGNLFKNIGWSNLEWLGTNDAPYKEIFELKTNEDIDDWERFIEFMDVLNNSSDAAFEADIQDYFNVDSYLRVLAIDVMTNNWDSYIQHGRNWYMYQDSATNQFQWLPWDYNLALGGTFDQMGDPQISGDTICPFSANFSYGIDSLGFNFFNDTDIEGASWLWDFGDGTSSDEQNPTHIFSSETFAEVCLTVSANVEDSLCNKTVCRWINLNFNPNDCPSVSNGSSPHDASDPIFIQVIEQDPFCCDVTWDGTCQDLYDEIAEGNSTGSNPEPIFGFDLMQTGSEKTLINRILNIPHFRERYLNICCQIMEDNFTTERILPIIDQQTDLIRSAVYADDNYLFTTNYFEYDATNTIGDGGVSIPPLKYFFEQRVEGLQDDLQNTQHDCDLQFAQIAWHDVVINEFMASNSVDGGIADPAGSFGDWIELYNNTNETIDLGTLYMSDDPDNLLKWRFDLGTFLAPDEYLIVWADKDLEEEGIHTNFKLAKDGESIFLTHEDGTAIDALTYDEQETNIASARRPNGTGDFVAQAATFNINNNNPPSSTQSFLHTGIDFRIYPNPSTHSFFVDLTTLESHESATVFVKNSLGQTLKVIENVPPNALQISTKDMGTGLLTVQVMLDNQFSVAKKVLVVGQ